VGHGGRFGPSSRDASWVSGKEMGSLENEIAQAQRRVHEAHRKIARQRAIISKLRNDGHATEVAESLLPVMLVTLRAFENHCRRLEHERLTSCRAASAASVSPQPCASVADIPSRCSRPAMNSDAALMKPCGSRSSLAPRATASGLQNCIIGR